MDLGGAVSVGQNQVVTGPQRSSLLFTVVPGGWGVGHRESLKFSCGPPNSLQNRPREVGDAGEPPRVPGRRRAPGNRLVADSRESEGLPDQGPPAAAEFELHVRAHDLL